MPTIQTAFDVYRHLKVGTSLATLRVVADEWRRAQVRAGRLEYDEPLTDDDTPITAYINEGRWLVDCGCRSGVPVTPWQAGNPQALCLTCGTVWTNVIVPPEAAEIEAFLLARRWRPNQNWVPGETVEQLQRDNAANPRGVR